MTPDKTPNIPHKIESNSQNEEDLWELDDSWQGKAKTNLDLIHQLKSNDSIEREKSSENTFQAIPKESLPAPDEPSCSDTPDLDDSSELTAPADEPTRKKLSILEKTALLAVASTLIGTGIYGYTWIYQKNQPAEETLVTFPVKGDHISIAKVATYWKTTTHSGNLQKSTEILPSAVITLSANSSSNGALRFYFKNSENIIVGDPITLSVENGKFTKIQKFNVMISESATEATITSSDGFHQEGDYGAYVLDETLSWALEIFEATSIQSAGGEYKNLLTQKINSIRR